MWHVGNSTSKKKSKKLSNLYMLFDMHLWEQSAVMNTHTQKTKTLIFLINTIFNEEGL